MIKLDPETCAKITYSIVSENRDTLRDVSRSVKRESPPFYHVRERWKGWCRGSCPVEVKREFNLKTNQSWVTWSQSVWYMFEFDRRMSRSWRSGSTTTWTRSRTRSPRVMVHSLSVWLRSFVSTGRLEGGGQGWWQGEDDFFFPSSQSS